MTTWIPRALFLALAVSLGGGGCLPRFRGPEHAALDPKQASAVDLIAVGGAHSFCPNGRAVQLKAVVTLAKGQRLETWSDGQSQEGRLGFEAFEWSSSLGGIDGQGHLRLPGDPFKIVDHTVTIIARVAGRPDLSSQVELSPVFTCGGLVDARGPSGSWGAGGWSGNAGQPGRSGDSSTAATDGQRGAHGQNGGDGGPGEPGSAAEVALAWFQTRTSGRLELVRVGQSHFLFDPRGQKLRIAADGGAGGGGGSGGAGGAGGSGGSNNIEGGGDGGNGGDGGDGGDGGRGGDGGEGGTLRVEYDARYPDLLQGIVYTNTGGAGGSGGSGGYAGSGGGGGSSASGRRGTDARQGQPGQGGAPGRRGRPGPPAEVRPAEVRQLFGQEIRAGLAIVTAVDVPSPPPE